MIVEWRIITAGLLKDECIEWQVNYGCQKFYIYLVKIQIKSIHPMLDVGEPRVGRATAEDKLCFDHELKIEKMAFSGVFFCILIMNSWNFW